MTSGCTALKFYSRDGLRLAYDITLLLYSLRVIVHGSMATLVVGGKRGPLIRFLEFAYQSWDRGIDPAATSVTSLVLKEYDLLDFWLAGEEGKTGRHARRWLSIVGGTMSEGYRRFDPF